MGRATVRVQLDGHAKGELDQLCADRGMTQIAVMSRLVRWLVAQNEVVQASVLGLLSSEAQAHLARQLLEQMATAGGESDNSLSTLPSRGATSRLA